jgi:hypothetical protein
LGEDEEVSNYFFFFFFILLYWVSPIREAQDKTRSENTQPREMPAECQQPCKLCRRRRPEKLNLQRSHQVNFLTFSLMGFHLHV